VRTLPNVGSESDVSAVLVVYRIPLDTEWDVFRLWGAPLNFRGLGYPGGHPHLIKFLSPTHTKIRNSPLFDPIFLTLVPPRHTIRPEARIRNPSKKLIKATKASPISQSFPLFHPSKTRVRSRPPRRPRKKKI
jgi:hypothetical protein